MDREGSGMGFARTGALLVGVVYLAAGLIGFAVTGVNGFITNGDDVLLGFDINGMHNVVHAGIGIYLIFVSQLGTAITEGALIGGGLVYLLAAFLGFADESNLNILSIDGELGSDNFLHLVSGSAALAIGLTSVASGAAAKRTRDPLEQG